MSDQCKNCEVRGDYEKCNATECFHHENWINKQRIKRIEELEQLIRAAISIKDLWMIEDVTPEHEGEAQALNSMLRSFEMTLE